MEQLIGRETIVLNPPPSSLLSKNIATNRLFLQQKRLRQGTYQASLSHGCNVK
jgi:hypothetical protein